MKSVILEHLYEQYNIENLKYGVKTDKLGDVYEDFLCEIFKDIFTMKHLIELNQFERNVIMEILGKININLTDISNVFSTNKEIPRRQSGGNPKTDVILTFQLKNSHIIKIPISVKQTSARHVAFAEYDVETICEEVGISDVRVKELMLKHQIDASAKNFTKEEKEELRSKIAPFAQQLVRWTITMSPETNPIGDEYPKWILKFNLTRDTANLIDWHFYNIEEYIDSIQLNKKREPSKSGFGTGLSWTYATGSKGTKIQFKG